MAAREAPRDRSELSTIRYPVPKLCLLSGKLRLELTSFVQFDAFLIFLKLLVSSARHHTSSVAGLIQLSFENKHMESDQEFQQRLRSTAKERTGPITNEIANAVSDLIRRDWWKSKRGSSATVGALAEACMNHNCIDLAETLLESKPPSRTAKKENEGGSEVSKSESEDHCRPLKVSKLAQRLKERKTKVAVFGNRSDDLYTKVESSLRKHNISTALLSAEPKKKKRNRFRNFKTILKSCEAVVDARHTYDKDSLRERERYFQDYAISRLDNGEISFLRVRLDESDQDVCMFSGVPTLSFKKDSKKSEVEDSLIRALYSLTEKSTNCKATEEANPTYEFTMNVFDLSVFRFLEKVSNPEKVSHIFLWVLFLIVAVMQILFSAARVIDYCETETGGTGPAALAVFFLQLFVRILVPAVCLWVLRDFLCANNSQLLRVTWTSKAACTIRKYLGSYLDRQTSENVTANNVIRKVAGLFDDILFYFFLSGIGQAIIAAVIFILVGAFDPPRSYSNLWTDPERNLRSKSVLITVESVCMILSLCCWQMMLAFSKYAQKILGYYFDLNDSARKDIGKDAVKRIQSQWNWVFRYLPIISGASVILLYLGAFLCADLKNKKDPAFFIITSMFSILQLLGAFIDTTVDKFILALSTVAAFFVVLLQPSLLVMNTATHNSVMMFLAFWLQAVQLLCLKIYSRIQMKRSEWSGMTLLSIAEWGLIIVLGLVWVIQYFSQKRAAFLLALCLHSFLFS
ncbi:uncharacterized protein [Oscarella lobularis]|uniref:uncharacterized protein isoform X2 n=1 Tax=Oscarella lobularis TaxID=121494 RepID=UPI003313DE49